MIHWGMAKNPPPPKPLPPAPDLSVGDMATTPFKPMFYDILQPTKILAIRRANVFLGWAVDVQTSDGIKEISASHFTKVSIP